MILPKASRSAFEADLIGAETLIALLRARREWPKLEDETVSMLAEGKAALETAASTASAGLSDKELEQAVPDTKLRSVLAPFKDSLKPHFRYRGSDEETMAVIAIVKKALGAEALTDADLSRASEFFSSAGKKERVGLSFASKALSEVG